METSSSRGSPWLCSKKAARWGRRRRRQPPLLLAAVQCWLPPVPRLPWLYPAGRSQFIRPRGSFLHITGPWHRVGRVGRRPNPRQVFRGSSRRHPGWQATPASTQQRCRLAAATAVRAGAWQWHGAGGAGGGCGAAPANDAHRPGSGAAGAGEARSCQPSSGGVGVCSSARLATPTRLPCARWKQQLQQRRQQQRRQRRRLPGGGRRCGAPPRRCGAPPPRAGSRLPLARGAGGPLCRGACSCSQPAWRPCFAGVSGMPRGRAGGGGSTSGGAACMAAAWLFSCLPCISGTPPPPPPIPCPRAAPLASTAPYSASCQRPALTCCLPLWCQGSRHVVPSTSTGCCDARSSSSTVVPLDAWFEHGREVECRQVVTRATVQEARQ